MLKQTSSHAVLQNDSVRVYLGSAEKKSSYLKQLTFKASTYNSLNQSGYCYMMFILGQPWYVHVARTLLHAQHHVMTSL